MSEHNKPCLVVCTCRICAASLASVYCCKCCSLWLGYQGVGTMHNPRQNSYSEHWTPSLQQYLLVRSPPCCCLKPLVPCLWDCNYHALHDSSRSCITVLPVSCMFHTTQACVPCSLTTDPCWGLMHTYVSGCLDSSIQDNSQSMCGILVQAHQQSPFVRWGHARRSSG